MSSQLTNLSTVIANFKITLATLLGRQQLAPLVVRLLVVGTLVLFATSQAEAQRSMAEGPTGGQQYEDYERPYNPDHLFE